MRSNAMLHPAPHTTTHTAHPAPSRDKVICIYCYRMLGATTSAQSEARLRHNHDCIEARIAKQPDAPPPFN